MKNIKKLTIVFAAYFCLILLEGCGIFGCGCPEITEPFFDFKTLIVNTDNTQITDNQALEIDLTLEDIEYLAQHCSHFSLGLLPVAYGCSCEGPGNQGLKYSIDSLNIFSDQAFNNEYPAGTKLNALFQIKRLTFSNSTSTTSDAFFPLEEETSFFELNHPYQESLILYSDEQPDALNVEHQLTIEILKSNGEKISSTLEPIIWK